MVEVRLEAEVTRLATDPEGASLTVEEKCDVSHRAASMKKFATWYLPRGQR